MSARRTLSRLAVIAAALATVHAAPATAAVRYATPTGGAASGTCASGTPCTIAYAVNSAAAGDVVYAAGGDYTVATPLVGAANLTIQPVPGQAAPILKGGSSLTSATLTLSGSGAKLVRVGVSSTAGGQPALVMRGGVIERSSIVGDNGPGAVLGGTQAGVLARDSVVVSRSSSGGEHALSLTGNQPIDLRNLTVWAGNGANGLDCSATGAQTVVNTIVRGVSADDIEGASCAVKFSNFRPGASSGVVAGPGNQSAPPVLGDTVVDFRPRAGSPTTDAGTEDALLGAVDFDGQDRRLGGGPDIGAHESTFDHPTGQSTGTPGTPGTTVLPTTVTPAPLAAPSAPPIPEPVADELAPPELGRRVVLGADTGTVKVKLPGASVFITLRALDDLPVGTVVDATGGAVTLSSSLGGGRTQTGTFGGGVFEVRQSRTGKGMTDIVLRGGSFAGCPRVGVRAATATAAAGKKRRRSSVVRRLWGKDRSGRFRTRGRNAVATVRGTRWVTEDRCDGTLVRVTEGAVDVRDRRTGRTRRVRKGGSLLVRAAR